jgi:hypothetical protein
MLKKLFFVTVLLLLVSVQALTVSCDLRCSLMGASTGCHAQHADIQMPHCRGMSMEQNEQTSLTASDSCAHTTCGTELKAITKSADQKGAGTSRLPISVVALLVAPFGIGGSNEANTIALFSRTSNSRPLARRPGSSLRI